MRNFASWRVLPGLSKEERRPLQKKVFTIISSKKILNRLEKKVTDKKPVALSENERLVASIVEGMQELKAQDIVVVDLSGIEEAATQAFVICTGTSTMHVDSVADSVREWVEEHLGVRPYNYDGYRNSEWIVIDYGSVYAHVFLPDVRERYKLEELWADGVVRHVEA